MRDGPGVLPTGVCGGGEGGECPLPTRESFCRWCHHTPTMPCPYTHHHAHAPAPPVFALPTCPHLPHPGRNIHALDPYRMPSMVAMQRGSAAAAAVLDAHRAANGVCACVHARLPACVFASVSMNMWATDVLLLGDVGYGCTAARIHSIQPLHPRSSPSAPPPPPCYLPSVHLTSTPRPPSALPPQVEPGLRPWQSTCGA